MKMVAALPESAATVQFTSLGDLCTIVGGGTPKRSIPAYFGGGIPWATPTDVTALDDIYISVTRETVTEEGVKNSSTKILPAGSVLLTSRATIGFAVVATTTICTNQGFANFICGPDIMPEYLAYWFPTQKELMYRVAGGTTFKEISKSALKKFCVPVPTLPEQRRIVNILKRADGIRRLRKQAQSTTHQLIPALFIDMFGDSSTNPKGWPVRKVSEFVERFEGGKNLKAGSERPDSCRILKVSAVTSGQYIESESKPAPDDYLPPDKHYVRPGDLLFSRANTEALVGATAIVDRTNGKTLLPDKLWRFVWAENVEPVYIHALFQSNHVRQELSKLSTGTSASMKNISQGKLRLLKLPVAPYSEQMKFSERVRHLHAIQVKQSAGLDTAVVTFSSLMARAFSGSL